MKKTVFMVIAVLLLMTFNAVAGDFEFVGGTSLSKLNYDLEAEASDSVVEENGNETIKGIAGKGIHGGVRYILDNGLGFGAGYNTLTAIQGHEIYSEKSSLNYYGEEKEEYSMRYKLSGPYIEMLYKVREMITLKGALVFNKLLVSNEDSYSYYEKYYDEFFGEDVIHEDNDKYEYDLMKGEGIGYQLGAELEYPFTDNLSITGTVSYIFGNLDITHLYSNYTEKLEKLPDELDVTGDYSGYSFGLGLNYAF